MTALAKLSSSPTPTSGTVSRSLTGRGNWRADEWLSCGALLLSTDAALGMLSEGRGADEIVDGDPARQILWAAIYAFALARLLGTAARLTDMFAAAPWIAALVGLAAISFAWSDLPSLSLRR